MRRLGVALRETVWSWVIVEHGWRAPHVTRFGEVAAGDWAGLLRAAGRTKSVGLAVPDRHAVLRRVRIGHPPSSRDALRRLLRWRLKDDLPFDSATAPLDGVIVDEHAIALAIDPEVVRDLESRAAVLGRVERVTSIAVASFNCLDARDGECLVIESDGHAVFTIRAGRVADCKLLDGAPSRIEQSAVVADARGGPAAATSVRWRREPTNDERRLAIAAVGAAL